MLYGVFRVGPDFERVKERQVASIDRGLSDHTQLASSGRKYARQKKWAKAILHYQRAIALAPSQFYYHRSLGKAYAHLGNYQRSLDVLESAYRLTNSSELKIELEQLITFVRDKSERSNDQR